VDDTPDLPLMSAVGLAAAVADAHPLVLSAAHWIARTDGGRGAVREFCDALLRARAGLTPPQRAKATHRVNAPARAQVVAKRSANRPPAAKVR
jgi:3-deoxy-D-manno-octulosonate 8-phosphate phosphatase KdsC-like HAD superfamily phosphatase